MRQSIKPTSRLKRIVYLSPWLPLFFVGVFAIYILAQFVPLPRFFPLNNNLLMASNICFVLVMALRFFRYASRLSREFRFDPELRPTGAGESYREPQEAIQAGLEREGFSFNGSGYGERRSRSSLAMTLFYGGILAALLTGTYDNLKQFSAVIFQGVGAGIPLSSQGSYFDVVKGPFISFQGLPSLKIKNLMHPTPKWPKGGAEVVLLDAKNAVIKETVLTPDSPPLSYGDFDYHFAETMCDVILDISSPKYLEFSNSLKLVPLDKPQGTFSHVAHFRGDNKSWEVLFDPTRYVLQIAGRKGKEIQESGDLWFRRNFRGKIGDYDFAVGGFAEWGEIHVVHKRHLALIIAAGVLTLFGALARLIFRPEQIWLDETADGCRILAVGAATRQALSRITTRG